MQSEWPSSTGAAGNGRGSGAAPVTAWPACPECRGLRHTECPVCGTAGQDFSRADQRYVTGEGPAGATTLWLICPTCDELFAARFLQRCQWCGHDFGEGRPVDVPTISADDIERLNGRVLLVSVGLLTVVVLAAVYLALILGD